MSDEITNETPTEVSNPETAVVEPHGESTDWKKEARKWEARAKEAAAFKEQADKWREYEENQKSDHEKLAEELARTKAEADKASAELLRLKIASEKGITGEALDLLTGTTQEELEAKAEKLLSLIADQSKPKLSIPDSNQGQPAPNNVGQLTRADLSTMSPAEINKARLDGRLDEVLGKN
jgi:hypothetical protein